MIQSMRQFAWTSSVIVVLWLCSFVSSAAAFPGPNLTLPASLDSPANAQTMVLIDRGSHELETGEFDAAIDHLTAAIANDNQQPQAYALRAYAKRQLGQFESALDDYSAILELQPRSATTYVDRGLLKGMLGDAAGAIADHTQAISIAPADARAYSSRGIARCVSGDVEAGKQDFRQSGVLSLNRGDYQLYSIALRSEKQFCR